MVLTEGQANRKPLTFAHIRHPPTKTARGNIQTRDSPYSKISKISKIGNVLSCHPKNPARGEYLLIRQIQPFLILQLSILRLRSEGRLLPVLMSIVPRYEQKINDTCTPAANNCHLGRGISRRVFWPECLRAWCQSQLRWMPCDSKKQPEPIILPAQ